MTDNISKKQNTFFNPDQEIVVSMWFEQEYNGRYRMLVGGLQRIADKIEKTFGIIMNTKPLSTWYTIKEAEEPIGKTNKTKWC